MQSVMLEQGWAIGRDQVRRLMRLNNICGRSRARTPKTTIPSHESYPEDHVNRNFTANGPNKLWVADMTYVKTRAGFAYTAFVIDVFTREIVGWNTAGSMPTDLPLQALEQAVSQAKNQVEGLIHHSDKGSQYCSIAYTSRLESLGITASTGKTGDAYDCQSVYT